MRFIIYVIVWIVSLMIFYYVIRAAVRDGIMDASKRRKRAEREAAGWDPQSGREGFS